jgi:hypothetical protein
VEIKEAFLDFIPPDVKTAEIITEEITEKLDLDGLNLEDCTCQWYDNQAKMAGVQKRILDLNLSASFCSLQQSLSQAATSAKIIHTTMQPCPT